MSEQTITQIRGWTPEITFPDRLRIVRVQYADRIGRKVGQKEIAELCGVSQQTWASWESGRTAPREVMPLARKIAEITGVEPAWLLGLNDFEVPPPPATTGGRRRSPSTKWYPGPCSAQTDRPAA